MANPLEYPDYAMVPDAGGGPPIRVARAGMSPEAFQQLLMRPGVQTPLIAAQQLEGGMYEQGIDPDTGEKVSRMVAGVENAPVPMPGPVATEKGGRTLQDKLGAATMDSFRNFIGAQIPAAGPLAAAYENLHNPDTQKALGTMKDAALKVGQGIAGAAKTAANILLPNITKNASRSDDPDAPPPPAAPVAIDPAQVVTAAGRTGIAPGVEGSMSMRASGPGTAGGAASSKDRKALDEAFAQQQQALQKTAEVAQQKAAEEHALAQERLKNSVDIAAQQAELQGNYKRAREGAMQDLKSAQDALAKGPDQERLWASRSTGQKILAGIGLVLGAVGARNDGNNRAAGVLREAINRDIGLQMETLQAGVKGKASILAQMKDSFQDDFAAMKAAEATMIQQTQIKLEGIASKYAGSENAAKLQGLAAQLEQDRVKALADFDGRMGEIALRKAQATNLYSEARARNGGSGGGKQVPAGQAVSVGELDAGIAALGDLWKTYEKKIDSGLGSSLTGLTQHLPGTDATEYNDKRKVAAQIIGGIIEGGKLTDQDFPRYLDMMPSAGDSKERAKEKAKAILQMLRLKRQGQVGSLGATGYDVGGLLR